MYVCMHVCMYVSICIYVLPLLGLLVEEEGAAAFCNENIDNNCVHPTSRGDSIKRITAKAMIECLRFIMSTKDEVDTTPLQISQVNQALIVLLNACTDSPWTSTKYQSP